MLQSVMSAENQRFFCARSAASSTACWSLSPWGFGESAFLLRPERSLSAARLSSFFGLNSDILALIKFVKDSLCAILATLRYIKARRTSRVGRKKAEQSMPERVDMRRFRRLQQDKRKSTLATKPKAQRPASEPPNIRAKAPPFDNSQSLRLGIEFNLRGGNLHLSMS